MNTIENNKLIAEFMGGKEIRKDNFQFPNENGIYSGYPIQLNSLKYHWSWDSLMEVVEKIESLNFKVVIDDNGCTIENLPYSNAGKTIYEVKKIKATYNACIKFIKYYNNSK